MNFNYYILHYIKIFNIIIIIIINIIIIIK